MRYRARASYFFVLIPLSLFFVEGAVHYWLMYVSYAALYVFGVEVGLHRSLTHGVRYQLWFERLCLWLASLCHLGGLKESVIYHLHHHSNADTDRDHKKNFFTAIMPSGARIEWNRDRFRAPLKRISNDRFLSFIDQNYYISMFLSYGVLSLLLGPRNVLLYVLIPAAAVLLVHRYAAYFYHHFGYRNFDLPDESGNVIWLWPFVFGENWHNNHHRTPKAAHMRIKWWELDLPYWLGRPFRVAAK